MFFGPLISIIVPFKIKDVVFLKELICCLSLYDETKCEFVFIDDCCDSEVSLEARHLINSLRNSVYIKNENNCGVSFSRNKGIEKSRGEYLLFVDSDDLIEPRFLKDLPSIINNLSQDSLLCLKLDYFESNSKPHLEYTKLTFGKKSSSIDAINDYLYFDNSYDSYMLKSACGKLFSRKVIEQNSIRFEDGLNHYEDALFVAEYCLAISNIVLLESGTFYYYRKNSSSTSHSFDSELVNQLSRYFNCVKDKCPEFYMTLVYDTLYLFVPYLLLNQSATTGKVSIKSVDSILKIPFVYDAVSIFKSVKLEGCINNYLIRLNKLIKRTPRFVWKIYIYYVAKRYLL